MVALALAADGTFEVWVVHPFAQNVKEIDAFVLNSPGGADRIVGKLGLLVRRIPGLDDLIKGLERFSFCVALEPFLLDHAATKRGRRLLILSCKIVFAH